MMERGTIRYIVDNVESAVEFYTQLLEFAVLQDSAPGFAILEHGNLNLLLNEPGAGGSGQDMPDGSTPKPGGWNRLQLVVENVQSKSSQLKAKGVPFRSGIIDGKGGKQLLIEDPAGNPVELFEPKNKARSKEDSHRSYKPEGYHHVTPYLAIREADQLAGFIKKVLGAEEHRVMRQADGTFRHGEFRIGDSLVMIGDVQDRYDPFPGMVYLYVPDVDETYKKALGEGAASIEEPADQEYGDRRAAFTDPCGNRWYVAASKEQT